ncbi:SHOCT domain-containing protein, partial [Streptomyces nodosus]
AATTRETVQPPTGIRRAGPFIRRGGAHRLTANRIRHLGELHKAGLVTDEEFSAKKAQLLAEL